MSGMDQSYCPPSDMTVKAIPAYHLKHHPLGNIFKEIGSEATV